MGGDEFVVLCEHLSEPSDAEKIATRIVQAVGKPIPLATGVATVTASVGIALGEPGETAASLIGRADEAMYRMKQGGKAGLPVRGRGRRLSRPRAGIRRARADDLPRFDAAGAGVDPARGPVHERPYALDVRIPPPVDPFVREGHRLAEPRLLPTDIAHGCHRVTEGTRPLRCDRVQVGPEGVLGELSVHRRDQVSVRVVELGHRW
jgi:diguanylate cyclase (GGDEF) domain